MRCLTLADGLRAQGCSVNFISQRLAGELSQLVVDRGYSCKLVDRSLPAGTQRETAAPPGDLQRDASATLKVLPAAEIDWLIVDQYQLCDNWYAAMRDRCKKILVIDDLANRSHDCDILHDQTLGREAAHYRDLTPAGCQLLLGTEFALLRPDFAHQRTHHPERVIRKPPINCLLVALGGSDARNTSLQILQHLQSVLIENRIEPRLLVGTQYQHAASIHDWAARSGLQVVVHQGIDNVAELLLHVDIAIGASGASAWERCCLGLPTLACVYASNQTEIAQNLERVNAALVWRDLDQLKLQLLDLLEYPDKLNAMSSAALAICDGQGVNRVVNRMLTT